MNRLPPLRSLRLALLTAVLPALLLLGCGGSPRLADGAGQSVNPEISQQVRSLLAEAQASESPQRDRDYLQAARLLVEINEIEWAASLYDAIDPDVLIAEEFVEYTLLFSRVAIEQDEPFLAQRILTNPRLEQQWDSFPPQASQVLRQRRAELFALLGESIASIEERVALSRYLVSEQERSDNQDAIWRNLMTLSEEDLNRLSSEAADPLLQGWYTLAALSKNNEADLDLQQARIDDWMARRPDHPASQYPPSDLRLLKQLVENQPRQVALMLPLNGSYENSGKAVRDGFMAAYFDAKKRNSRIPQVRIFDTSAEESIDNIYQLAVADGAEMIIGPLEKEHLEQLNLRLNMPVPTLALNEVDNAFGYAEDLYQFGLGPEDEARQVARRAWLEGHRNAMLLVERLDGSDIGVRAAETFIKEWTELGGTVVNQTFFERGGDYNQIIQTALLVNQSRDRRQNLQRLLGLPLEFQPRRRHDVDMIFLFARPESARQIKPTLTFHNAGTLPVYSTRRVYSGSGNPGGDRDLDEIRFSALPWLFDSQCPQKQPIVRHAKPDGNYTDLYALGVDAYRLYPRLRQLEQINGAKFYGCTGALELLPNRQIEREQVWARIVNGKPQPLPMVVSEAIVE